MMIILQISALMDEMCLFVVTIAMSTCYNYAFMEVIPVYNFDQK